MFELRDPLLRQIIFAMENQNIRYVIDTAKGQLVRADALPESERPEPEQVIEPTARYQSLPEWTSADGFYLMEQFVGQLHNPIVRDALQEILVSGRRVFRRFKDAIKEQPDVERRFYAFKFLEMRGIVVGWYNQLRELNGLDLVELGVDEELDDLVYSDVTIAEVDPVPATLIAELDRQAFHEAYHDLAPALVRHLYKTRVSRLPTPGDARSTVIAATTPIDELSAFVWITRDTLDDGTSIARLVQVYVLPEYRGLGIGSTIVEFTAGYLAREKITTALASFPGANEPIYTILERNGFTRLRTEFLLGGSA